MHLPTHHGEINGDWLQAYCDTMGSRFLKWQIQHISGVLLWLQDGNTFLTRNKVL